MATDKGDVIHLLDAKRRAGRVGGKGYAFQVAYAVSCLPAWLADPRFRLFLYEGAEDVDVLFEQEHGGRGEWWSIQVKSNLVGLDDARGILDDFRRLQDAGQGAFGRFTLACPAMSDSLKSLRDDVRQVGYLEGAQDHPLLPSTRDALRDKVRSLNLTVDADFLTNYVHFEDIPIWLAPGPDSRLKDLFVGGLMRLRIWPGISPQAAEAACDRLRAETLDSIGRPRSRADVENILATEVAARPAWALPVPKRPVNIPAYHSPDFVGRDHEMIQLHSLLQAARAAGRGAVGLVGLPGMGKTRLAAEYADRWRGEYPAGVFWVPPSGLPGDRLTDTAAIGEGLAVLGRSLLDADPDRPTVEMMGVAGAYLHDHPDTLLVLDNLSDPALLDWPLDGGLMLSRLPCPVLFTTRRHDRGRFPVVELNGLPEPDALELLLRPGTRQAAPDSASPDYQAARRVCALLGGLPLGLEIVGAFLTDWPDTPMADLERRLRTQGRLVMLEREARELAVTRGVEPQAVALEAAFAALYRSLDDKSAGRLLQIAGQLPEPADISDVGLGLLAGISGEGEAAEPSDLHRALLRLRRVRLIQEPSCGRVRLHPLVHEFCVRLVSDDDRDALRAQCATRLAAAYRDEPALEKHVTQRGVDAVLEDLLAACSLLPSDGARQDNDTDRHLRALRRLFQREAGVLRGWQQTEREAAFAQQVHYRAMDLNLGELAHSTAAVLDRLPHPWLALCWRAGQAVPGLEWAVPDLGGSVHPVLPTSDGQQVITGAVDGSLMVWDLTTGRSIRTLAGDGRPVAGAVLAPDGHCLVVVSGDGTLRMWDLAGEQGSAPRSRILTGSTCGIGAVALAPDGKHMITGGGDGNVCVWTYDAPAAAGPIRTLGRHGQRVLALAVAADGRVVSGSHDGTVRMWDMTPPAEPDGYTRPPGRPFAEEPSPVRALAVLPNSPRVAVGTDAGSVSVRNLDTGQVVYTLAGCGGSITALATSADGRWLIVGSGSGKVTLWDLSRPAPAPPRACTLVERGSRICAVAATPDGRHAIAGNSDGTLRVWDLAAALVETRNASMPAGHCDWVAAVAATPDGRRAVTGSGDGTIQVWDLAAPFGPASAHTLTADAGEIKAVAITPDGHLVLSGGDDFRMRVWSVDTRQEENSPGEHDGFIQAIAVTPDGRRAVSGSGDGTLKVWDLAAPTGPGLERTLDGSAGGINTVAVTPDGHLALAGDDDGELYTWDISTPPHSSADSEQKTTVGRHSGRVRALAIAADGRHVLSGAEDGSLQVWLRAQEPATDPWCTAGRLGHHAAAVRALAVLPNSPWIVSGAADRTLRLWHAETGQELATLTLDAPVWAVAAGGRDTVVVGDVAGSVYCFQVRGAQPPEETASQSAPSAQDKSQAR